MAQKRLCNRLLYRREPGRYWLYDEPVNLQVLVNQLSLHGAQVDPVTDGKQALTRLNSDKKYDLVILDVMMPGLSGLEVCREIRKAHALSDLPVLMLTARNRPEDVVTGLEAGANDYLAKPFDSAELFARVKSLATFRKAVRHGLHLKRFNDEHSHAVGDQVLVQLARTIKSQCRQADVAGRYGGEEIAMLMPQTDAKAAGEVAERLRKAIADEPLITAGNRVLKITVSIGVATFIAADEWLDRLLGRADQALSLPSQG